MSKFIYYNSKKKFVDNGSFEMSLLTICRQHKNMTGFFPLYIVSHNSSPNTLCGF